MNDNTDLFSWEVVTSDNRNVKNVDKIEAVPLVDNKKPDMTKDESEMSDITKLLSKKNAVSLNKYLSVNLKGRNIPVILKAVEEYLQSKTFDYDGYWYFVDNLTSFNASVFLATLAKNVPLAEMLPECDEDTLYRIVINSFSSLDKFKHALRLVSPCKKKLSYEMTDYIIKMCIKANSPALICETFQFLDVHPSIAINILKDNMESTAALYALYDLYKTAKENKLIQEDTIIEVYSLPYITSITKGLSSKDEKKRSVGLLIGRMFFQTKKCINYRLLKLVEEKGYLGFQSYFNAQKRNTEVKEFIETVSFDKYYEFIFIKKLDNHLLLLNKKTNYRALLPYCLMTSGAHPKQSDKKKKKFIEAKIINIDKRQKIMFVSQKDEVQEYKSIPLVNIGSIIDVSFIRRGNIFVPRVRNYTDLIRIRVLNMSYVTDYKLKYKAQIVKSYSIFDFDVKLISCAK